MADRTGTSTRRPEIVISPEDLEKYYSGKVLDAAGVPILNDEADLTGNLQVNTPGIIFFYDKNRNFLPLNWKSQIDLYLIIWDTNSTAQNRVFAIDKRMDELTSFSQKLIEFGSIVSKGSASFKATVNTVSIVFSLVNKAFGAFSKVFFTALSWNSTRQDSELISKCTTALKRLENEANGLLQIRAKTIKELETQLPITAANLAEYQATNTLENPEGTRNADTNGGNTALIIVAIVAGYFIVRKFSN